MLGRLGGWIPQRDELRQPLLEEQFGRLDARVGMEAPLHRRPVQHVVEREQDHALVMGHPGAQHDAALVSPGTRSGV